MRDEERMSKLERENERVGKEKRAQREKGGRRENKDMSHSNVCSSRSIGEWKG